MADATGGAMVDQLLPAARAVVLDDQVRTRGELQEQLLEADRAEDVIGKCVYPLIAKADLEAFRSLNESVFNGNPGGSLEFCIRGLRGSERIFVRQPASVR